MMTDPIADMLTRIRNAATRHSVNCVVPGSRLKVGILEVLKREGYIDSYAVSADGPRSVIQVRLRYGPEGEQVISSIDRFSKPGCRRYRGCDEPPKARGGPGHGGVSHTQGTVSHHNLLAREERRG